MSKQAITTENRDGLSTCRPCDIVSRKTRCGTEVRVSYNVYFVMRRDELTFAEATKRCEALAYYTDDAQDALAARDRFADFANALSLGDSL